MDFRNDSRAQNSRGLRNNNPGNLRYSTFITWQGQVGSDPLQYVTFSDSIYGLRAMALDLYNNYYLDGITTLTDLINKYAPADDPTATNNPTQYAAYVSSQTGIPVNADIQLSGSNIVSIMRAMMNEELGASYSALIPDSDIQQAVTMLNKQELQVVEVAATGGSAVIVIILIIILIAKRKKKS